VISETKLVDHRLDGLVCGALSNEEQPGIWPIPNHEAQGSECRRMILEVTQSSNLDEDKGVGVDAEFGPHTRSIVV
jgi:hypothetical protein